MLSNNELFIRCNIRKSKRQIISVCLLIILSVMLLNIILILFGDFKSNFFRKQKELNCSSFDLLYANMSSADLGSDIKNLLDAQPEIAECEVDKTVGGFGTVQFNDGLISSFITLMSFDDAREKNVNRFEFLSSDGQAGVYLSYLFHNSFDIDDKVAVNVNGHEYLWRIAGFYNALGTGTSTCLDNTCILTDELFESVCRENPSTYKISVKAENGVNLPEYCTAVTDTVLSGYDSLTLISFILFDDVYTSRYAYATVFKAVLIASVAIMIIVMVFVVAVSLNNYISGNIRYYGTWKAMGYQSFDLIKPLVLEFAGIALIFGIVGVALSYPVFIPINNALETQIGIPYDIRFVPIAAVISVSVSVVIVALTTYLSVRKIKKISAMSAIRQDKKQEKSGINAVSLAKTGLSVNTAMGLKNCLSGISRSLIVFLAVIGVSFLCGFSVFLSQNILGNIDEVMSLMCGQTPESIVRIGVEEESELVAGLQADDDVESFYLYYLGMLSPNGCQPVIAYMIENTDHLNQNICISGHLPQHDNEIAINKAYALKNGLDINDRMTVNDCEFVICGFTQGAYCGGWDCYILRGGYEKTTDLYEVSYYVNLNDGADVDAFNDRMTGEFHLTSVVNQKSYINSLFGMYSVILKMLVIILVALSLLIIVFVLYVMLSILLENKKKEHGILKSLGFVSREIIYQTVVSILPSCLAGTAVGLLLARYFSDNIVVISLTEFGVFRFGSNPDLIWLASVGAALIVFIIVYAVILSGSVRKIAPHDLFNRE